MEHYGKSSLCPPALKILQLCLVEINPANSSFSSSLFFFTSFLAFYFVSNVIIP